MPQPKLKATDNWATLFANEIQRKETVFPPNAKSIDQIMEMRKATGFPASHSITKVFLAEEIKSNRVKLLRGVVWKNGKRITAARYIIVA